MAVDVCSEPDCGQPHRARGLCSKHWKQAYAKPYEYHRLCQWCGVQYVTRNGKGRTCCSTHGRLLAGRLVVACGIPDDHPSRSTPIPPDHPRWWIGNSTPVPYNHLARRAMCQECGQQPARWDGALYCSKACSKRISKRRRRAREYEQLASIFRDLGGCASAGAVAPAVGGGRG